MTTNRYRCNKCGCIAERSSRKRWLASFCERTGKNARLYRVKNKNKPLTLS